MDTVMPIDPPRPLACPCCASKDFAVLQEINFEMVVQGRDYQMSRHDAPRFEMWTCMTCGRTELFAMDPAKFPEQFPYMRRVVDGQG
jgi:hypothetical protein